MTIDVLDPLMWDNDDGPKNWFAITNDYGIFAYANNESLAFQIKNLVIKYNSNHCLHKIEHMERMFCCNCYGTFPEYTETECGDNK